ncbi:hypothetical protein HHI36_021298 [Cryptolaemus montrouzieri]|uniref:Uncharacterized protein n=1 Tax=Cryptolaemus montrouzieri TaxID=559131 RepID=A0ABD2MX67_9CUCU
MGEAVVLFGEVDWSSVLADKDVGKCYESFQSTITHIMDKVAPKCLNRKRTSKSKPWITKSIKEKSATKGLLFEKLCMGKLLRDQCGNFARIEFHKSTLDWSMRLQK